MEVIYELEQDREFCLHGIEHSLDVARIAYILNLEEQLQLEKTEIYAAALLHDIGRAKEYQQGSSHHEESAKLANQILRDVGYEIKQCERICAAIGCHKEMTKEDGLAKLLYRADKLSRNCFACQAKERCYWSDEQKNQTIVI
ncbi:MAG: HD domain-containing protein [Wujia sp.]